MFLELNLNHYLAAQELPSQTVLKNEIDGSIICEYYEDFPSGVFLADRSGKAEIWTCGNRAIENTSNTLEDELTRANVDGIRIISYVAPSPTLDEFVLIVEKLAPEASRRNPVIIVGVLMLGPKIGVVAQQMVEQYFQV